MQINIGFGINDKFCQHCACTMASILANASSKDDYTFFIVYDELSKKNIAKLKELKKIKPFETEFIKVDYNEFKNIAGSNNTNISIFFRLKLFMLENVDKILYLDSDIVVREDIRSLYETDISDFYLGGAKDIIWKSVKAKFRLSPASIYINTGMILINVEKTREVDMEAEIEDFMSQFRSYQYSDQDIINYIFQEQIRDIDIKYNFCYPYVNEYEPDYYNETAKNPIVVHYITANKPWTPGSLCFMKSEYFKYLYMTPYYEEFMSHFRVEENAIILTRLNNIEKRLMRFA